MAECFGWKRPSSLDTRRHALFVGAHVLLYSRDAEADRAFIRDTLGFGGVDAGEGWLIFQAATREIACHPTDGEPKHEFHLMCDNIDTQLAQLSAKGVEISSALSDQGWGRLASIKLPSGADLPLYGAPSGCLQPGVASMPCA
jgi:hypothetical protein